MHEPDDLLVFALLGTMKQGHNMTSAETHQRAAKEASVAARLNGGFERLLLDGQLGYDAGDANLTRYVGNGPTSGVDPSGFIKITLSGKPSIVEDQTGFGIWYFRADWNVSDDAKEVFREFSLDVNASSHTGPFSVGEEFYFSKPLTGLDFALHRGADHNLSFRQWLLENYGLIYRGKQPPDQRNELHYYWNHFYTMWQDWRRTNITSRASAGVVAADYVYTDCASPDHN